MAVIGTTALTYAIASQYMDYMVPAFEKTLVFDQLVNSLQNQPTSYNGKGSVCRVVLEPAFQSSTTTISQSGLGGVTETSYAPTAVDITIGEYGKIDWNWGGKASMEFFDNANAAALRAATMAGLYSFDGVIGAAALSGGTTAATSVAGDATRWKVINPTTTFKPAGYLTTDHIQKAFTDLASRDVPMFMDGLYAAVVHPAMIYDLQREIAAAGASMSEWSLYRQAGLQTFGEYARGIIGVYGGFVWFQSTGSYMSVSAGADDGSTAYKTLFCGRDYLATAFVPSGMLPYNGNPLRVPIHPNVEVRITDDASDVLGRNKKIGYYFVGGCKVARKNSGLFYVSKSQFASLPD